MLKCTPSLVSGRWSVMRNVFFKSMSRNSPGLLLIRLRIISFHWVTLPFIKSATGVPTYGFCGIVHSTISSRLCLSFSSFKRQTTRGSHLLSGVTGSLEMSLVPSITIDVFSWSSFWNSIVLIAWAMEAPPKDRTVV